MNKNQEKINELRNKYPDINIESIHLLNEICKELFLINTLVAALGMLKYSHDDLHIEDINSLKSDELDKEVLNIFSIHFDNFTSDLLEYYFLIESKLNKSKDMNLLILKRYNYVLKEKKKYRDLKNFLNVDEKKVKKSFKDYSKANNWRVNYFNEEKEIAFDDSNDKLAKDYFLQEDFEEK